MVIIINSIIATTTVLDFLHMSKGLDLRVVTILQEISHRYVYLPTESKHWGFLDQLHTIVILSIPSME